MMSNAIENAVRRFQTWGRSKAHWLMLAGALINFSFLIWSNVSGPQWWLDLFFGICLLCAAVYWKFKAIPAHPDSRGKSDVRTDKDPQQP
jgi:hypothetical protein